MQQILAAVKYCHMQHIVHRDLKPENIVFTETKSSLLLKVIDFGRSKVLKPYEKVNEMTGTVNVRYNFSCSM
jgi:serine/threonine protein kinase